MVESRRSTRRLSPLWFTCCLRFLTNKQKRHLAKQDRVMGRVGVTSRGDNAKDELLHASQ